MKQKNMFTWAISAIVYLGLVIGGYSLYASFDNNDHSDTHAAKTDGNEEKNLLMSKHIKIIILAKRVMVKIPGIQIM